MVKLGREIHIQNARIRRVLRHGRLRKRISPRSGLPRYGKYGCRTEIHIGIKHESGRQFNPVGPRGSHLLIHLKRHGLIPCLRRVGNRPLQYIAEGIIQRHIQGSALDGYLDILVIGQNKPEHRSIILCCLIQQLRLQQGRFCRYGKINRQILRKIQTALRGVITVPVPYRHSLDSRKSLRIIRGSDIIDHPARILRILGSVECLPSYYDISFILHFPVKCHGHGRG